MENADRLRIPETTSLILGPAIVTAGCIVEVAATLTAPQATAHTGEALAGTVPPVNVPEASDIGITMNALSHILGDRLPTVSLGVTAATLGVTMGLAYKAYRQSKEGNIATPHLSPQIQRRAQIITACASAMTAIGFYHSFHSGLAELTWCTGTVNSIAILMYHRIKLLVR